MKANEKTKAEVLTAMNKYLEAYQKRDIEAVMSLFAPDADQVHFGTGADEKRIGRDQIGLQVKRDWSQTEALAFNLTWHQISTAGSVAWIAAEGLGQGKVGGQAFEFPMRMTGVLEKRGDEWLLVQSHASSPAASQEEGDSVPV